MRHTEAETQAEGEAGSMQVARRGTLSRVSRIRPRAAGGAKPLRPWGCPVHYSSVNGLQGVFQFLAIMNKVALNIHFLNMFPFLLVGILYDKTT